MAKYIINQRISFVNNSALRGKINFIHKPYGGHQHYDILMDTGSLKQGIAEYDIEPEVIILDAWDAVAQNKFGNYLDFNISSTFYKIRNTTNNTIATLNAARTIFKPYQFKPLIKFLNSGIHRVLIADEVGLGKTIEAGYIMLELFARRQLNNVLVLCPKSLCDKWEEEMFNRFNFVFKNYNSAKDVIDDVKIDVNRGVKSILGICNYEKLRNPELVDLLKNQGYYFDLIICDEAHKLRNHTTQMHKSVKEIVPYAKATVFLTATPIMNKVEDFYNLIMLLDEEHYANRQIFYNDIEINKPFITALKKVNASQNADVIITELENHLVTSRITIGQSEYIERKMIKDMFFDNENYLETSKLLKQENRTFKEIVQIQNNLTELNNFSYLFTRSRKKYVENGLIKRNPIIKMVDLKLTGEDKRYKDVFGSYGSLGLIMRKRQASSCLPVLDVDEYAIENSFFDTNVPDAKYDKLLEVLKEFDKPKIIIFTFFRRTLLYLKSRLSKLYNIEYIYGGMQKEERTDKKNSFKDNLEIKIFISTEVGSEGIDLQFCDTVINYDLPWNPMVVEQRIGRIDRIGQESDKINIVALIIKGSIDEKIYEKLLRKIRVFDESIGGLTEILTEYEDLYTQFNTLQETLYTKKLTEEEQDEEINRLEKILEENAQNLADNIEKELDSSLVYDIHVENEIKRIKTNKKYLTEIDLRKYLDSILRNELSTLRIEPYDKNKLKFVLPKHNSQVLNNFIEKYIDKSVKEIEFWFNQFRTRYIDEIEIPFTLDRDIAFKKKEKKEIVFINAYHPLINAITNYFEKKSLHDNKSFAIAVKKSDLKEIPVIDNYSIPKVGKYLLVLYRIEMKVFDGRNERFMNYIYSLIANLNKFPEIDFLPEEQSEYILGVAQEKTIEPTMHAKFTQEDISKIRTEIFPFILERKEKLQRDEERKQTSRIRRRYNQEKMLFEQQIKRRNEWIKNNTNPEVIRMWNSDITRFTHEISKLETQLSQVNVYCESQIISVSYMQIL